MPSTYGLPSLPKPINSTQYLGFLLHKAYNHENPHEILLETLPHTALYPYINDPEVKLIMKELTKGTAEDFTYKNINTEQKIEEFLKELGFKYYERSEEWRLKKRKSFFENIKEKFQTSGFERGSCKIL